MKELHGSAKADVAATPEECFALVRAIEGYPGWYPEAIRRVEVLERSADGEADKAQAELHLAYGPLTRSFDLELSVTARAPSEVRLVRVAHGSSDPEEFTVVWQIEPGRLFLTLRANLSVPRLLPVSGIGESLARDFLDAATRRLDG